MMGMMGMMDMREEEERKKIGDGGGGLNKYEGPQFSSSGRQGHEWEGMTPSCTYPDRSYFQSVRKQHVTPYLKLFPRHRPPAHHHRRKLMPLPVPRQLRAN